MLKLIILILLIAMIISLAFSGVFLIKDAGKGNRTKRMLGIRVSIAVLLLLTIGYGISTGELRIKPTTEALSEGTQTQAPAAKQKASE